VVFQAGVSEQSSASKPTRFKRHNSATTAPISTQGEGKDNLATNADDTPKDKVARLTN